MSKGPIARFLRAQEGGLAMLTAVALPAVAVVAVGAVQISDVYSYHAKIKDVADSAALYGALQTIIAPTGVTERTQAWALEQLQDLSSTATTLSVTPVLTEKRTIKVAIDANVPSFFASMFPPGGFNLRAEATAKGMNQSPLCVLSLGEADTDLVALQNTSKLQGPACLVHSNQAVSVAGSAMLKALSIESVTGATGPITPTPDTNAPLLDDPFADVNIDFPSNCPLTLPFITLTNVTLPAGVHCFDYDVQSNTTLTLAPGNHYFGGYIRMKSGSQLVGSDVVMVFSATSTIEFKNASDIRLSGRQTGNLAGFVMAVSRQNTGNFILDADHISKVTGTIYSPNAQLEIGGQGNVADQSQWTVVATRSLKLFGAPNLIINADYSGSVPVPEGVGNRAGVTHLVD